MPVYYISQEPIVQATIQAEGEEPIETHHLFQRPRNEHIIFPPELFWDASHVEPYDRLPRFLVFPVSWRHRTPRSWESPKFHYGWRPDVTKLLNFAMERGLVVSCDERRSSWDFHHPSILRPQPHDKRSLNYIHYDDFGPRVRPKPITEALWPALEPLPSEVNLSLMIDLFETISEAVYRMMCEASESGILGDWCKRVEIWLTLRVDEGHNFIISVINSHDHLVQWGGEEIPVPAPEDLERLAAMLGVSGPPKWYVDRDICQWIDYSRPAHPPEFDTDEEDEDDDEDDEDDEDEIM